MNLMMFFLGVIGSAIALDKKWVTASQLVIGGVLIYIVFWTVETIMRKARKES